MEPYRTTGWRCPQCPEMPLREFQARLICDECQGMLIEEDDLVAACSDLVSEALTIAFSDVARTASACPHCERPLDSCVVTFAPIHVTADVLRCDRHGLWFKGGVLAAVFALLGRKKTGLIGYPQYSDPISIVLEGRHRPATSGLRIGEWRTRPRRREPTLTPINAYRDQPLPCPVCKTTELKFYGDRYACAQCTGTFVQNAAFEAMAMDISHELFQLPPPAGSPGARACPVCTEAMLADQLDGVELDRCAAHGIWFDANELSAALARASGQFDTGWRAWLRRVFS
ncbi:MAG TPA: zf-TFIIB domain-containing protein [Kofleriaceae bacterium]